jgi:sugar phosphate permease
MNGIEERTMSRVSWRLLPYLVLCYFVAFLDRVNIGFAGPGMVRDLGFTAEVFGGAAGIFFLTYFSRSSMRLFMQEPMKTRSTVKDSSRSPGLRSI